MSEHFTPWPQSTKPRTFVLVTSFDAEEFGKKITEAIGNPNHWFIEEHKVTLIDNKPFYSVLVSFQPIEE